MKNYSDFVAMLSSEFHLYLIENKKRLPKNALVVFSIDGDRDFNKWHRTISLKNKEPRQKLVYVQLKKWRRYSSIENIDMQIAA